jgi:hypothetical protein
MMIQPHMGQRSHSQNDFQVGRIEIECEPGCILWLTDWSHYLNFKINRHLLIKFDMKYLY